MSNDGPVTRLEEWKDGDFGLSNSVLQEFKVLNSKIQGGKASHLKHLES